MTAIASRMARLLEQAMQIVRYEYAPPYKTLQAERVDLLRASDRVLEDYKQRSGR